MSASPTATVTPLPRGRLSLYEMVYENLRNDILMGKLSPGQILRQEEIAHQFGISRVPLREAMARLESEGLLELRPRRGYTVTALDPSEVVEIFELRAVVEQHAGEVAGRSRSQDDIAKILKYIELMEGLKSTDKGFFEDWSALNHQFHGALIEATHRPYLVKSVRALRGIVEPYIRVEARITGDVTEAHAEHRAIFNALKSGNAALLGKLSREHVESTAERLLKGLHSKII